MLLFVGRIQPLKAPEVLVAAAADLLARNPDWRGQLVVAVLGGPSGSGLAHPHGLEDLAAGLGISAQVRFAPPVSARSWCGGTAPRTSSVPSHSESFGLVAVEAQACGTPVVAANVGGLPTAIGDAGVLVDGHDPHVWSQHLEALLRTPVAGRSSPGEPSRTPHSSAGTARQTGCWRSTSRRRARTLSPIGVGHAPRDPVGGGPVSPDEDAVPGAACPGPGHRRLPLRLGHPLEQGAREGEYVLTLPGEAEDGRLAGGQRLPVRLGVRHPEPRREPRGVLPLPARKNLRLGLAYAVDASGDVYVTGKVPAGAVDAAYLDQLLGVLLQAADSHFNELLALGFLSSMRKEWAWRVSRGESTRNLEAFRHLLEDD